MRLLVVDHNALEPAHRKLYDELARLGDVTLRLIVPARWFNGLRELTFRPPVQPSGYDIFSCDVLFPTRTHRLIYRSLSTHLKEFRPHILYINAEPENFQTFQAARLCSSPKTQLVFSSWRNIDHVREGYPYKLAFLHRSIETYVLKRAAHGIVFNNQAKKIFSLHGYHATTVIPPPVDMQLFSSTEQRVSDEQFVVGYVGRLVEGKGVDLLLEALALLPGHFRVVIVGDGPAAESLKHLARELRLADRVEFKPPVLPTDLPAMYATFDALVLPSRTTRHWREQFGRVLVEAMACGVPVIGSSSGEIPDVIGDAGLVFKEGSVEGLRLGLERLAQNERLRDELRQKALRRVREKYELTTIAQRMHRLFLKLGG